MNLTERLRDNGTGQLEITSGGGCISIFGIPFLAAGVFAFLLGFGIIEPDNADELTVWSYLFLTLFGVVFGAVGAGLVFGRQWIVLDPGQGRILVRRGLLVSMWSKEIPLQQYSGVKIVHNAGDSDSKESFPVTLTALSAARPFTLCSPGSYGDARSNGEAIARVLGFSLIDATTAHEVPVAAARTMGAIAPSAFPTAMEILTAAAPTAMRCSVSEANGETVIVIPGPGLTLRTVMPVAIPLVFAVIVLSQFWSFLAFPDAPEPFRAIMILFLALFIGLPVAGGLVRVLKASFGHQRVSVSNRGIDITTWGLLRNRVRSIPGADILGIDFRGGGNPSGGGMEKLLASLGRNPGIVLKTRSGIVTFGDGLTEDESRYICSVIARVLRQ